MAASFLPCCTWKTLLQKIILARPTVTYLALCLVSQVVTLERLCGRFLSTVCHRPLQVSVTRSTFPITHSAHRSGTMFPFNLKWHLHGGLRTMCKDCTSWAKCWQVWVSATDPQRKHGFTCLGYLQMYWKSFPFCKFHKHQTPPKLFWYLLGLNKNLLIYPGQWKEMLAFPIFFTWKVSHTDV